MRRRKNQKSQATSNQRRERKNDSCLILRKKDSWWSKRSIPSYTSTRKLWLVKFHRRPSWYLPSKCLRTLYDNQDNLNLWNQQSHSLRLTYDKTPSLDPHQTNTKQPRLTKIHLNIHLSTIIDKHIKELMYYS